MKSKMRLADKALEKRLKKVRKNGEYFEYDDLVNLLIDSRRKDSVEVRHILTGDGDPTHPEFDTVSVSFMVNKVIRESLTTDELFLLGLRRSQTEE